MSDICEGLYQSPGIIPYYFLAILLILWMEKGFVLSQSLKKLITSAMLSCVLICKCSLMIYAKAICPTLIIQPHPVSVTYVPLRWW